MKKFLLLIFLASFINAKSQTGNNMTSDTVNKIPGKFNEYCLWNIHHGKKYFYHWEIIFDPNEVSDLEFFFACDKVKDTIKFTADHAWNGFINSAKYLQVGNTLYKKCEPFMPVIGMVFKHDGKYFYVNSNDSTVQLKTK